MTDISGSKPTADAASFTLDLLGVRFDRISSLPANSEDHPHRSKPEVDSRSRACFARIVGKSSLLELLRI